MNQQILIWCVFGLMVLLGVGVFILYGIYVFRQIAGACSSETESESKQPAFFETTLGQRILGLVFFLWGSYFAYQMWVKTARGEEYQVVFWFAIPLGLVMSLVMLLFPFDMDTQRWNYGTARPRNWSEMPNAWKVGILSGVVAGVVNLIVLASVR